MPRCCIERPRARLGRSSSRSRSGTGRGGNEKRRTREGERKFRLYKSPSFPKALVPGTPYLHPDHSQEKGFFLFFLCSTLPRGVPGSPTSPHQHHGYGDACQKSGGPATAEMKAAGRGGWERCQESIEAVEAVAPMRIRGRGLILLRLPPSSTLFSVSSLRRRVFDEFGQL